jgi:hypothetical protein
MVQLSSEHELMKKSKSESMEDAFAQITSEVEFERGKRHRYQNLLASGQGDKVCASTIMKMDISKDQFLVGDVFMRKFYTVFDRDNDKVGLAEAKTSDKVEALSAMN